MRDPKRLSQERYTQFADGYVTSETHAHGTDLDRLLAIAQPRSHWRALDIATGGGHTALKFAPRVAHVIASDLTPRMLEKAQRFIVDEKGVENVSFRQADAEDLPFADAQFDLVTCRIAPHHFPDAQGFLRECARVLNAGGMLMLQDHVLPADREAARLVETVRAQPGSQPQPRLQRSRMEAHVRLRRLHGGIQRALHQAASVPPLGGAAGLRRCHGRAPGPPAG